MANKKVGNRIKKKQNSYKSAVGASVHAQRRVLITERWWAIEERVVGCLLWVRVWVGRSGKISQWKGQLSNPQELAKVD